MKKILLCMLCFLSLQSALALGSGAGILLHTPAGPDVTYQNGMAVLTHQVQLLEQENEKLKAAMVEDMLPKVVMPAWFKKQIIAGEQERFVLLMVVLLCAAFLWWQTLALSQENPDGNLVENEEEYNYLETEAAIPAKLDLAQAYLSMGDYESACTVLSEVMDAGDEGQRDHAQMLLDKIGSMA